MVSYENPGIFVCAQLEIHYFVGHLQPHYTHLHLLCTLLDSRPHIYNLIYMNTLLK